MLSTWDMIHRIIDRVNIKLHSLKIPIDIAIAHSRCLTYFFEKIREDGIKENFIEAE